MELSGATRFKNGLRRRSVLGSSVVIVVSKVIVRFLVGGTGAGLESFKIFFPTWKKPDSQADICGQPLDTCETNAAAPHESEAESTPQFLEVPGHFAGRLVPRRLRATEQLLLRFLGDLLISPSLTSRLDRPLRIGRVNTKDQVTLSSYLADGDFEGRRLRLASSRDAYQIGE